MNKTIIKTPYELDEWFNRLYFHEEPCIIGADTESTGLDIIKDELLGFSFCWNDYSCYINLWENPFREDLLEKISEALQEELFTFVFHHYVHDGKFIFREFGFHPNYCCTYLASFLLDENRYSHKLKDLAIDILGVGYEYVVKYSQASQYGEDSKEFADYAMNDAIWALQLFEVFDYELKQEGLDYLYYDIENPFLKTKVMMEYEGVYVSNKELVELRDKAREIRNKALVDMIHEMGEEVQYQQNLFGPGDIIPPINFNSTDQLVPIIQDKFGLKITEKSKKTKKPSCGAATINRLRKEHPFMDALWRYKKSEKLLSSFVLPAFDQIDEDGRIRPNYGNTVTLRLTCKRPNLQNLAREVKELDLNYRKIFIPKPGYVFVGMDYAGQELCMLAEVTGDRCLITALKRDEDLHLKTANRIFGLGLSEDQIVKTHPDYESLCKKYSLERYRAKNGANFPIVYGTTQHGIAKRQGVPVWEAHKWLEGFFSLYPDVKKEIENTERELKEKGYVTSIFGARRRFPGFNSMDKYARARAIRQAFNFKVQGPSATQIKIASNMWLDYLLKKPEWDARVVLSVHDELVTEVKKEYAEACMRMKQKIMEGCVSLRVPFQVEAKIGMSYAELK